MKEFNKEPFQKAKWTHELKNTKTQVTMTRPKKIPKSAIETLTQMLEHQWERTPFYDDQTKNDLINIAESYGLDGLVKRFNETINE